MRDGSDGWFLTRRAFLGRIYAGGAALTLAAACGRAPSPAGPVHVQPQPEPTFHVLEQIGTPSARSTAEPGAAPISVTRVEPKGRLVYAYTTTIPPAWLDPQENPPKVTPYLVDYALHVARRARQAFARQTGGP